MVGGTGSRSVGRQLARSEGSSSSSNVLCRKKMYVEQILVVLAYALPSVLTQRSVAAQYASQTPLRAVAYIQKLRMYFCIRTHPHIISSHIHIRNFCAAANNCVHIHFIAHTHTNRVRTHGESTAPRAPHHISRYYYMPMPSAISRARCCCAAVK